MKWRDPIVKPPMNHNNPWQMFTINQFGGGLVTSTAANQLEENQFTQFENVLYNPDGTVRSRMGRKPYSNILDTEWFTASAEEGVSFFLGDVEGNERLLVAVADATNVTVTYESSGDFDTVVATLDKDERPSFVKFAQGSAEEVIIANGVDAPLRWDGTASAATALGLTAPTTNCTAATGTLKGSADGGVTANGVYTYKYTYFYNESGTTKYGESNAISVANTTNTVSVTTVTSTAAMSINITLPTDISTISDVEAAYIYRSRPDRDDVFYYVGRVTTGTTFTDTTETGAEGLPLPVDDGSVPKLLYPKNIDGRIVAVDGDIQNKLVWSPRSSPDQYPALNYIYFRDKIKGLAAFNGSTYVFTQDEIFSIPNSNFSAGIAVKICDKGAVSDRSIVDVGSGLVWLGDDTVYWANFNVQTSEGDFPIAVGRPVEDLIKGQAQAYKENACATFFDRHYYLSFTTLGTNQNNLTLAMNTDIMQASLRTEGAGWIRMDWTARDLGTFEEKLYSLELETTLTPQRYYLYEHEEDRYVDYLSAALYTAGTSSAIDINIRSGELHFGSPVVNKLIKGFSVSYYGDSATYNVTLDANNGEYEESFTLSNEGTSAQEQGAFLFWNTLTTNDGAWYGHPDGSVGWYDVNSVTEGGDLIVHVADPSSELIAIPVDTDVYLAGVTGDVGYNKVWTVQSVSNTGVPNVTSITMNEDSSALAASPGTAAAQIFTQFGTKVSATASEQYYWATSQRGNNTIRKKCPTMKCSRLIYEITGLDHRDARLGSLGIIYKILPTAF
jgi:hypothetical protein